jgi:hypothetical protein
MLSNSSLVRRASKLMNLFNMFKLQDWVGDKVKVCFANVDVSGLTSCSVVGWRQISRLHLQKM